MYIFLSFILSIMGKVYIIPYVCVKLKIYLIIVRFTVEEISCAISMLFIDDKVSGYYFSSTKMLYSIRNTFDLLIIQFATSFLRLLSVTNHC